jgi:predicted ester cyclase
MVQKEIVVHLQNNSNENCLQCLMLKELHGEKINSRWEKNDKMTIAKRTHNKN